MNLLVVDSLIRPGCRFDWILCYLLDGVVGYVLGTMYLVLLIYCVDQRGSEFSRRRREGEEWRRLESMCSWM